MWTNLSYPSQKNQNWYYMMLIAWHLGGMDKDNLENLNHRQPIKTRERLIVSKYIKYGKDKPLAAYIIASSGNRMS